MKYCAERIRRGALAGLLLLLGLAMPGIHNAMATTLTVQSDHLDIWENKQEALFTGHVHMVREDFELYCDKLRVFYRSGQQGGGIDHALATGKVRMVQGDKKGTADSALIDNNKHTVTLRGHAVMEQPGGRVAGDTIVHDMQTKTTEVLQGNEGGRVSLRIDEKSMNDEEQDSGAKTPAAPAATPAPAPAGDGAKQGPTP